MSTSMFDNMQFTHPNAPNICIKVSPCYKLATSSNDDKSSDDVILYIPPNWTFSITDESIRELKQLNTEVTIWANQAKVFTSMQIAQCLPVISLSTMFPNVSYARKLFIGKISLLIVTADDFFEHLVQSDRLDTIGIVFLRNLGHIIYGDRKDIVSYGDVSNDTDFPTALQFENAFVKLMDSYDNCMPDQVYKKFLLSNRLWIENSIKEAHIIRQTAISKTYATFKQIVAIRSCTIGFEYLLNAYSSEQDTIHYTDNMVLRMHSMAGILINDMFSSLKEGPSTVDGNFSPLNITNKYMYEDKLEQRDAFKQTALYFNELIRSSEVALTLLPDDEIEQLRISCFGVNFTLKYHCMASIRYGWVSGEQEFKQLTQ